MFLFQRFRKLLHSGRVFRVDAEDTKHVYGVCDATSALVKLGECSGEVVGVRDAV